MQPADPSGRESVPLRGVRKQTKRNEMKIDKSISAKNISNQRDTDRSKTTPCITAPNSPDKIFANT